MTETSEGWDAAAEVARGLELKIQQAQKLESLALLAGGIAHDFNNLLVGILGNVGLALLDLPKDSAVTPILEDVREAALRAAELTKQMLAYSGRGRFVIERLNLNRLVDDMSSLLGSVVSKKANLRFSLTPDLPDIEADGAQIRQIVLNLVTNASDALDEAPGLVSITTGWLDAEREYLRATYLDDELPAGRYVFIEVTDTGSGMDAATKARIFDPFFTTKFTGRGLGLAAVLGILRGHRGAIRVDSEPRRGSTFRVLFPAAAELIVRAPPPVVHRPADQRVILIADDEPTVRSVAGRILSRNGYRVLFATHGREAVELYAMHADEIALVLLDMTMPELSGVEALDEMRRIRPDVRVVLSSGYGEQEAARGVTGVAVFLHKPWLPSELLAALERALDA